MSIRNALEELLLIVEIHQKCTKNNFAWAEVEYAKELFAQPEQTEQTEPVAWRYKTHNRYTYTEAQYHELEGEGEPLYASPPKREPLSETTYIGETQWMQVPEPLSDDEIIARYKAIDVENALYVPTYYAGFRDAEKAYGIEARNSDQHKERHETFGEW